MKSSTICREWLDSLPPTQGCLKKEQSLGRELLLEQGIPSNKDEAWRLCNFNRLNSFLSLPIIINNKDVLSKLKYIFPEEEKDRERIIIQPNSNITYADADGFSCSLWYSHDSDIAGETNIPDSNSLTFVQRHGATVTDSQCKASDDKFFKYNNYYVSQSVDLDLAPGSILFPRIKSVGTNDFITNIYWVVNYTKIPL